MGMITLIFGGSFHYISLLVMIKGWFGYSHVALLMPDGVTVIEAQGGVGVVRTDIDDFKARYRWWCVAKMPCLSVDRAYELANHYADAETPYDEHLTFYQAFGLFLDNKNKLNCSEKTAIVSGLYRADSAKYVTPKSVFRHCIEIVESFSRFKFRKPTRTGVF